ncbi:BON domain-containing protein [Nevskia sp.]|uniref:BON domain-containing protein n=1 Tax=Nevskia sp. TaxID=1929292 RepID=UPI003F6F3ECB
MNIHPLNRTLIAAALIASFGLAACKPSVPDGQMSDGAAANAPKDSATLGAALDDTGITAKLKGRLASDARIEGSDISVETNNGVVTLSGSAKAGAAKEAAEELARNVEGVKGVDNQITAPTALDTFVKDADKAADRAGEAITDTVITTKLKAALIADETTKGTAINVTTTDGRVTLSGKVTSGAEREKAISIATRTEGVKKVDADDLKVGSRS